MVCVSVPIFIDLYELGFSLSLSPTRILWLPSAVIFFLRTLWLSRCISLGHTKSWSTMGTFWRTEYKCTFLLPGLAQGNLYWHRILPSGHIYDLEKANQLLQSLCICREDLERFVEKLELNISWTLTCAPPSTYISINRVWKPYYKYLNMHLSQADAWAKQIWWKLLGSLAKI